MVRRAKGYGQENSGLWLEEGKCNVSNPRIELDDGVGDFEKVPPDRLCPSAKHRVTV